MSHFSDIRVDLQKIDMTKIIVNNNGSLKVEGEFEVVDMDGNRIDKIMLTIHPETEEKP